MLTFYPCTRKALLVLALLVWCPMASTAFATQPSPIVQDEVQHLLTFVGGSGCEFLRNGAWYSAAEARDHLNTKYNYLVMNDSVKESEDFISGAATKSIVSGQAYQVRCQGNESMPGAVWISEELSRYREENRGRK